MAEDGGRRTPRLAVGALAAQSAFLGFNWYVMKIGLRHADLWPFVALRTGLGAVALLALLVILRRPFRPQAPLLTVALGLLQTTAQFGLLMWALDLGSAGRTSALVYAMPFWLMMLAWVFLGEKIRGLQWLSAILALAGLVAILDPSNLRGSLESKLLAIGAGLAWAGASIVAKKIARKGNVDILNLTAWQMFLGAIPLVAIAFIVPQHHVDWTPAFVGALVYNVIPATAVAWFLWLYVLQVLPAGIAGVGTLAAPVIGIVSSSLLLHEKIGAVEGVGMGLILAALLVLTLRGLLGSVSRGLPSASRGHPQGKR
jgi:drug/metabolite transporter (DMT)-like permease